MQANKTLGVLLVLVGVCALAYLLTGNGKTSFHNFFTGFTQSVYDEQLFDSGNLSNISIESNSLDVDIVRASGDDIVVTLAGRATKNRAKNLILESDVDGDKLKLSMKSNNDFRIGFNWSNVKLTVALPDKTWDNITAKLNSGDIEMSSVAFHSGELRTNSGDIKILSTSASEVLEVAANSGDLKLEDITAYTIKLAVDSGDLDIARYEAERLEFDIGSGDVAIVDGYAEIKGETRSGDIHLEADSLTRNTTLKAGSGDVSISLAQDPDSLSVQFKSSSGDTIVHKSGFVKQGKNGGKEVNGMFGSGELKLSVRTGSGDIILR